MQDTPKASYHRKLSAGELVQDPAQAAAVVHLQRLYDDIIGNQARRKRRSWLRKLLQDRFDYRHASAPVGLYFWGGVGRGKTLLMDVFYDSLPFAEKMRVHFHRFMRRIHRELGELKYQPNPLHIVADKLAREAEVICFDEFFVADIADAMLLAGLLEALFARGIVLVATSNIAPDGLYANGLQRARFLPAIDLLNTHTEVVNVDGGIDYRLRTLVELPLYYYPLGAQAQQALMTSFERLVPDLTAVLVGAPLVIEGREIPCVRVGDDVAWFEFHALCDGPRSQHDYIELACEFHTVLVANIPAFDEGNGDQARRFIFMVDEFYDRSVKLVVSAVAPVEELYRGGSLAFEFERTISRIRQMQSPEYLARPHRL